MKLLLALLLAATAVAAEADLVLKGTITRADYQNYRTEGFMVPAGTKRVSIEFSYTGREQKTTLDLGVRDSARFRGWSGGNKSSFTIAETDATPSYLPGALSGEPRAPSHWSLIIGVPAIQPGVTSEFTAKIYFDKTLDAPLRTGPGWYRGDLHMHTGHSDGTCASQSGKTVPCPVYKTVETAAARGLDFIAITDHNTLSQYDAMRELQPYFDKMLLIHGEEVTTFHGHATVWGTSEPIDFQKSIEPILKQVADFGALISINHPASFPGGDECLGCAWDWPGTDFSKVQAVEIVNGAIPSGVAFWENLLNRGFRIAGVGGSDDHRAQTVGQPSTVVFADDLSEASILRAIRAGHVFVDLSGSKDRMLEMTSRSATMGDAIQAARGERLHFAVHVANAPGAKIEAVMDGNPIPSDTDGFDVVSDGRRHWVRVNVRSANGALLMIGNPIYLNFQ